MSETEDPKPNTLRVGTNGKGEVVINHPDLKPDDNGVGHIVFSPEQARHLANILIAKAFDAQAELSGEIVWMGE